MPGTDTSARLLDRLLRSISNLPPAQIARAEAALATARRRAEAVVEIDAVGEERACPDCGGQHRSRWGKTRTGAQRWRCGDCDRTWTGRSGTPIARVHRPGLFIEVARNMLDPDDAPLSCRKLGSRLGISRDTVWRWRMVVLDQLKTVAPDVLSGIIETDDTAQRESRKGSREWVRHQRDPSQPMPPRRRWYEYPNRRPPKAIAKAFEEPILGVVDRAGRASFQHLFDKRQPAIDAALVPQVAPDAMVLFDGAPQYEAIAKSRGISYHILYGGKRGRRTPRAYHLNTVNSLHAQWEEFIPQWRGPATKYLDGYARWLVARRWADPVSLFRAVIT
ncbi:IS1595 family transposase [Jannaschia sp. S6380]|uniref:IS1595 family transposase n=1 Tax=Jannaschia sp. S6380 TaxID=2926408 RepID=UPI001FF690BB|nr:IS1595 family transposase [Jannaschia sp. S6380]MCK0167802.1 IS1595 family transposase [Jannaschia sp. S6380]